MNRFYGNGLYLLDEPEAALSPLRQLSFLAAIHDLGKSGSQFIIATHSPIIMAYPNAAIYWFSDEGVLPIPYTETEHYKTTRAFMANPAPVLGLIDEGRFMIRGPQQADSSNYFRSITRPAPLAFL